MRPRRQGMPDGVETMRSKPMYLTLAQQWLDIAEIGDAPDRERDLRDEFS